MEDKELENLIQDIKQIEQVGEGLDFLNSNKLDSAITISNFIAEFSRRNQNLIHSIVFMIIKNFKFPQTHFDNSHTCIEGSLILIPFALRDIIENIEILSWLKLNNNTWFDNLELSKINIDNKEEFVKLIISCMKHESNNKEYISFNKKLLGKEKMTSYKFSNANAQEKNLEQALEKKFGKLNLSSDFIYIRNIKKELHNSIHKNGVKYINPSINSYIQSWKKHLNNIKFIYKFYFKIVFLLDGTCVSSRDYVDYLECGMTPPEDCQYWVAPIFDEYIFQQFNTFDKNWLKKHNTYNMQFEFLKQI